MVEKEKDGRDSRGQLAAKLAAAEAVAASREASRLGLLDGNFARKDFELKDGPKGRRRRRCASHILDFKVLSRPAPPSKQ